MHIWDPSWDDQVVLWPLRPPTHPPAHPSTRPADLVDVGQRLQHDGEGDEAKGDEAARHVLEVAHLVRVRVRVSVGVRVSRHVLEVAHRRRRPRDVFSRDLVDDEGALEVGQHRDVLARAAVHGPAVAEPECRNLAE